MQIDFVESFATRGLSRGVQIWPLSIYPTECEVFYPLLTYLPKDEAREITMNEDGVTIVPTLPQVA